MRPHGTVAVMDDHAARKCAAAFGIPVKGTLGLTLLVKTRGKVTAARPVVAEFRRVSISPTP